MVAFVRVAAFYIPSIVSHLAMRAFPIVCRVSPVLLFALGLAACGGGGGGGEEAGGGGGPPGGNDRPRIVFASPSDGQVEAVIASITIEFGNRLEDASIDADQITVEGPDGPVAGTVRHITALWQLKFEPIQPFMKGAAYTARLKPLI